MARFARVVGVGRPHHVTQRGNARAFILATDADRAVYLDVLRQNIELHGITLMGYCLMSNHVHIIAVPHSANSLSLALKDTHGRYGSYWNALHHSSGHVWQGRFYSCPLDQAHLWEALRYTELNPVRWLGSQCGIVGMVKRPGTLRRGRCRSFFQSWVESCVVESAMVPLQLVCLLRGSGNRSLPSRHSPGYPHGSAARYCRVRTCDGKRNETHSGSTETRASANIA